MTGDRFLAEDITQDSFLQAYRAIGRFQADRPFAPWFLQIVTNTTRMRQRSAKRRREVSLEHLVENAEQRHTAPGRQSGQPPLRLLSRTTGVDAIADPTDPTEQAERMEERAALALALAALTRKQREAVVLRYYFGYGDQEIGAATHLRWPACAGACDSATLPLAARRRTARIALIACIARQARQTRILVHRYPGAPTTGGTTP
ncbi:MAG: RNA polymerase sigma factor [Ktedonobacterales bacterium]